jgi:hypothetical protein
MMRLVCRLKTSIFLIVLGVVSIAAISILFIWLASFGWIAF